MDNTNGNQDQLPDTNNNDPPKDHNSGQSVFKLPTGSAIQPDAVAVGPPIVEAYFLDKVQPLKQNTFPNQPQNGSNQTMPTITNVQHLLDAYGITVRYNVIKKKPLITVPGYSGAPDNATNVAMTQIVSLATLNSMPIGQVPNIVEAIGDRHLVNPVADWINSKAWDGVNRFPAIYETLTVREGFPRELKETLMHRWLISLVAAALKPSGFRARGVLTIQGAQSLGKTAWINALVPDPVLRESVVKLDHHLDAGSKDSILNAVSHWLVEIGELDSSFRKDIARLKGFLTSDRDKIRRPYGRAESEYARKTVFAATVNDDNFLVDTTGNSRWWVIPVIKINYAHWIDMQQVFAQLAVEFHRGEPWWLTQEEERLLEVQNKTHRAVSATRERVEDALDLERADSPNLPLMTATELLRMLGITNPTNPQCKDCAAVLKESLGPSRRIKGQNKWRVPMRSQAGNWDSPRKARDDEVY